MTKDLGVASFAAAQNNFLHSIECYEKQIPLFPEKTGLYNQELKSSHQLVISTYQNHAKYLLISHQKLHNWVTSLQRNNDQAAQTIKQAFAATDTKPPSSTTQRAVSSLAYNNPATPNTIATTQGNLPHSLAFLQALPNNSPEKAALGDLIDSIANCH